jgi:hypothetical protein
VLAGVQTVGSSLLIIECSGLTAVVLDTLQTVGGVLEVAMNPEVQSVSLGGLSAVGAALIVKNNAKVSAVAAPKLRSVGHIVEVVQLPYLRTIELPMLTALPGSLCVPCRVCAGRLVGTGEGERVGESEGCDEGKKGT